MRGRRPGHPSGAACQVWEWNVRGTLYAQPQTFGADVSGHGAEEVRPLFMLAADWEGTGNVDDVIARRTGQVLVAHAPAPGVGWP